VNFIEQLTEAVHANFPYIAADVIAAAAAARSPVKRRV
jgi:hypothetical protein